LLRPSPRRDVIGLMDPRPLGAWTRSNLALRAGAKLRQAGR
jgi:hypothetical protein